MWGSWLEPFKNCFSVYYNLVGLLYRSPFAFKARCFAGLISQVLVLKGGMASVGFKPFVPQGEAWGFEFPTDFLAAPGVRFMVRLSQPLLPLPSPGYRISGKEVEVRDSGSQHHQLCHRHDLQLIHNHVAPSHGPPARVLSPLSFQANCLLLPKPRGKREHPKAA